MSDERPISLGISPERGDKPGDAGRSRPPRIPRGIEVLVMKASVDREFRKLLLEKRRGAAEFIGLKLEPAEADMLAAIPAEQLEAIIDNTKVPEKNRRAFLSKSVEAMLAVAVVGVASAVAMPAFLRSRGHSAKRACYELLHKIDAAKEHWAIDNKNQPGESVSLSMLVELEYLKALPKCPQGGEYSVHPVGQAPSCSLCGTPEEWKGGGKP